MLDKILGPFFPTETSRNRDTGLGLAIAHNWLRAQSSQLSSGNRQPRGLVATVVFART